jgi:hypothetical protein
MKNPLCFLKRGDGEKESIGGGRNGMWISIYISPKNKSKCKTEKKQTPIIPPGKASFRMFERLNKRFKLFVG